MVHVYMSTKRQIRKTEKTEKEEKKKNGFVCDAQNNS